MTAGVSNDDIIAEVPTQTRTAHFLLKSVTF